jgi:hypothetical protein
MVIVLQSALKHLNLHLVIRLVIIRAGPDNTVKCRAFEPALIDIPQKIPNRYRRFPLIQFDPDITHFGLDQNLRIP